MDILCRYLWHQCTIGIEPPLLHVDRGEGASDTRLGSSRYGSLQSRYLPTVLSYLIAQIRCGAKEKKLKSVSHYLNSGHIDLHQRPAVNIGVSKKADFFFFFLIWVCR